VPNLNPKYTCASAVCMLINEDINNVIAEMATSFSTLELLINKGLLKPDDFFLVLLISLNSLTTSIPSFYPLWLLSELKVG